MNIEPPKKTITEVLYGLITRNQIKERDYDINSFRAVISDLKKDYGLPIQKHDLKGKTKHNRPITYRVHYLWKSTIPKAIKLYNKINA